MQQQLFLAGSRPVIIGFVLYVLYRKSGGRDGDDDVIIIIFVG